MIAFWILLILSFFQFALAAPVPVGEIPKVRSNAADVLKGIRAWEKRMDINSENRWPTNEAYWKGDNPGSDPDPDPDGAPGSPNEKVMLGWESPWDSDQMESDARGPDRHYLSLNDAKDPDGAPGDDAQGSPNEKVMLGWESPWDSDQMESDARGPDHHYLSLNDAKDPDGAPGDDAQGSPNEEVMLGWESPWDSDQMESDARGPNPNYLAYADDPDNGNSGYDGDSDSGSNTVPDATQSSQGSGLGPESEHPTPGHMSDFGKLLNGELRFRPRNSGSGAVGTPKEGAAGNR
jgi:metal-sulfur cluster biosynthetic enzyme